MAAVGGIAAAPLQSALARRCRQHFRHAPARGCWPTKAHRPTLWARWYSGRRRCGATAPRTWSSRRWNSCSGRQRWCKAMAAPHPLPRRAGTRRQAAQAGGAASARAGCPVRKARRLRGERRASPPGAAELGQAAEASIRDRSGALTELRRRVEDHRGDPETGGDREDPRAPGLAGQGIAFCTSP